MSARDLAEPVPGSAGQDQEASTDAEQAVGRDPADMPLEADEADVAEQARELDLGEEDYR